MSDPTRRDVLRGAGLAAMASMPVLTSSAGVAGGEVPDRPRGVHIAYGPDPASSMNVGWSGPPATDATVRYGEVGGPKTTIAAEPSPVPGRRMVTYAARLTGLDPATEYEYEVVLDGATRGPFTFETPPDASDGFRVTAVGDHGIADPDNPGQRANTDDPERVMATAQARNTDIQILSGDIAYANGKPSTWERYFDTFEDFFATTPFMTTAGNHEAEPGTGLAQYDRRLNDLMPTYDPLGLDDLEHEQRWYDFDYGNTRFVSLTTTVDNCGDAGRGEEYVPLLDPRCMADGRTYADVQEEFLRKRLADAAADDDITWTVVFFHGPLWTDATEDHEPRRDLRSRWGPVLDEYGVDLVLSGDNHVWERTRPIAAKPNEDDYGPAEAWDFDSEVGTTFITNGTGGTSHYPFGPTEPGEYLARRTNEFFGVTELDIDDERIRVEYVTHETDENGDPVVADAFEIRKSEERTPAGVRYPKQVAPGDAVAKSLSVSGSRTDDGSVFTAGQTNQIDLSFDASHPAVIRDRIPVQWDVVGGDAVRTEPGRNDTQLVYFDADVATTGSVTYFVEAPPSPEQSGPYAFGPFEAFAPAFDEWMVVSGTTSEERVVGLDTNLG